jgi:tRNA (guanine37-N1)-methyltransferase
VRFDIVTLFPELIEPHLQSGITRRAFAAEPGGDGAMQVQLWPLRDYAEGAYRRVDDRPYGGGPGMLMMAEPLLRALAAIRAARGEANAAETGATKLPVVHFTPTGRRIDQALVREFASGPGAVLICARYEGIDQRFIELEVTHELSLGDFVLSGGEIPALALLDAAARLQQGVLAAGSHEQDSFSEGLLEGPHYTRPEVLHVQGERLPVPPVLLSGHHGAIALWRRERALELTARRRPDLIAAARAAGRLSAEDERFLAHL